MTALQEEWLRAWRFAADAHRGQTLPGSDTTYLVHIGSVAMEVLTAHRVEPFEDPALAVQCALLHDVLEDTPRTDDDLAPWFRPEVVAGVRALTKDASLPKDAAMADSLRRIREQPPEVWAVKLADRITNLDAPPVHWPAGKVARYRVEAGRILAELGVAHTALAARLATKIAAYPPPATPYWTR